MSEKSPNPTSEPAPKESNPYEGIDNATLTALAEARASIDEDSPTKTLDLRSATGRILENGGVESAFARAHNLTNTEVDKFIDGAAEESKKRHVVELQSIVEAYDAHDSFADRREALREALIANGHEDAFKKIYDMNNLELQAFVDATRREYEDATKLDESAALAEAYDEHKTREGKKAADEQDPLRIRDEAGEESTRRVNRDEAHAEGLIMNEAREELLAQQRQRAKAEEDEKDRIEQERSTQLREGEENFVADDDKTREQALIYDKAYEDFYGKEADELERRAAELEAQNNAEEDRRKNRWHKRAMRRLNNLYLHGLEIGRGVPDRYRGNKRATAIALGVVAGAGAILALKLGVWDRMHEHAQDATQGSSGGSVGSGTVDPTPKNPHTPGSGTLPTPVEVPTPGGDMLPPSTGFKYPWNWAEKAFGADDAMTKLRELADKAAADGHKIEWHGSGTHEWVEVDGNSNTKHVIDIFRQFAK